MRAFLCASLLALLACHSTPEPIQFHVVPGSLDHVMLQLMAGAPPARALAVTLVVADEDEDTLGYALDLGDDHWLIQIDASMDFQLQRMVLTHEWAHVLVGDGGCGLEGNHGPTFGVAWAAAWRAVVGEED
jgi:hypothetical protein